MDATGRFPPCTDLPDSGNRKAGRLSTTRTETGSYSIDGAELARVFPFPAPTADQDATGATSGAAAHHATPGEVAALREMLAMMREQNADLRADRDHWREQAQRLTLAPAKTGVGTSVDVMVALAAHARP